MTRLSLLSSLVAIATVLCLTAHGVQACQEGNNVNWTQWENSDCSGSIVSTGTCSGDENCACEPIVGNGISTETVGECSGFIFDNAVCAIDDGFSDIPPNTGCFGFGIFPGTSTSFSCGPPFN
ncbi:hypothetical protein BDP27DRAFT_1329618 [Rhodocollybia butyracea]|uniref:Extracellular membrane protein CFEM domain-containing protein n=1 Tax=Rhodocollybia butyracea TaxID=206335 RepID=A0A9P5U6N2_9AGAR|nr:hypothetical protein BDP27DRAFT_1329618 [Rhodocollybia butyracea]